MTVAACVQAGTRADVAWLVGTDGLPVPDWSDAVVFTPGGGHTGSLLNGALDGSLADHAGRLNAGRLLDIEVTQVDALIAGLTSPGSARCVIAPAETLPPRVWELAANRQKFCLVLDLEDAGVRESAVFSADTIAGADDEVREVFEKGSGPTQLGERLVSVFDAVPQLVVVGGGPIAEALVDLAGYVGWQAHLTNEVAVATGLITPLSGTDHVVVAAHDLELAGAALSAALSSRCGYIGSVGSQQMQTNRADWLAYRGITDLSRVHGPAGLDIGASTPREIAVSIVAEAIAK